MVTVSIRSNEQLKECIPSLRNETRAPYVNHLILGGWFEKKLRKARKRSLAASVNQNGPLHQMHRLNNGNVQNTSNMQTNNIGNATQ